MDKKLITYFERNTRCAELFADNPEKCNQSPLLLQSTTRFTNLNNSTNKKALEIKSIGRITKSTKFQSFESLVSICEKVGKLSLSYAKLSGDRDSETKIISSKTNLLRLRDYDFVLYAHWFLGYLESNKEALTNCGITEEMITKLKTETDHATELEQEPRNRINRRKNLHDEIEVGIKETTRILNDEIDNLMAIFPETDPFYIAYFTARTLIKPQTAHKTEDDYDEE